MSATSASATSFTASDVTLVASGTAISARMIDLAGNTASVTASNNNYTLDTTPPAAPTMSFVDTGASANDAITANGNITITGLQNDASWQYQVDGTGSWITGNNSALTALLGSHSYQVRQTDLAGNSATSSAITVDYRVKVAGFVINGQCFNDYSGYSVSGAGDVNGDGLADVIVGAPYAANYYGVSYVVFGKTSGTAVDLSSIASGAGGFSIQGVGGEFGKSVSAAGDLNGDGLADLIVGAPTDYPAVGSTDYATGRSAVIFGKTDTTALNLSDIAAGTGGFVIIGQSAGFRSGTSVSAAGDVNGDGLADVIVGSPIASGFRGFSYVVFGNSSNTTVNLAALGTGGFVINGQCPFDNSGTSVSAAGDVNGDGLADLIVGAYGADPAGISNAGRSYVVFGKSSNTAVDLSTIASGTSTAGFVINGQCAADNNGYSVSSAGDVNGDGLVDLIVGAYLSEPTDQTDNGRSYVVFGKTTGTAVNLSDVSNGTGGFVINGHCWLDQSGISVSAAGDVNGDGLADLIVGANLADISANMLNAGRSYVIFGKTDTNAVNLADIVNNVGNSYLTPSNTPTTGADSYTGTTASEIILGAAGNDTLIGNGGADVLYGGVGNDVLVVNSTNISALASLPSNLIDVSGITLSQLARIDGGAGIDTLRVAGGAHLNLSNISQIAASNPEIGSRISSIERIDLATDTSANTLTLGLADVLDMTGLNLFNTSIGSGWSNVASGTALSASVAKHQLAITGGASDRVDIDTSAWTKATGSVSDGSVNYDVWNHNTAAAQLLIQTGVVIA